MKIMHELNQLEFGGVEKVIRNIIKFDNENQHSILAYKDGPYKEALIEAGAEILIPTEKNQVNVDADVLHIHTGGDVSNVALNYGKHFPIIETIHSPIKSPMRPEYIKQRIGVSDAVTKINNNCKTIYNGLDLKELEPTIEDKFIKSLLGMADPSLPVIGRLGRIGYDKGLEDWLLTCYYLQQNGLEFYPLIIGGEALNSNGYIGKLKLMVESLPVKNVIWTGHIDDVANYLQIMDVFLYPSATEGFGLVFAEAMYNEAIVVTYDTPVANEVVGGHGILTPKTIDGLMYGVQQALNKEMVEAIMPIARDFVATEFNAELMAQKYTEVYKNVCEN